MENMLIVVITDTEYKALIPVIDGRSAPRFIAGATLERGFLAGREVTVCKLAGMGSKTKGSVGASLAMVIDDVKPSLVLEVGICFSLKDKFKIGDVCIARLACDYEYQKVSDGVVQHRARSIEAGGDFLSEISYFGSNGKFNYNVFTDAYACGDKVVDDINLKRLISELVPEAMAGDMESYTLALTCEERGVPWCVVKAACDNGVQKDDRDQDLAAKNAVGFVFDFFESKVGIGSNSDMEVDVETDKYFFEGITQEITGKKVASPEVFIKNKVGFHIHQHPDMVGQWIIVYLFKAPSVPEALRALTRYFKKPPARIDLCIVSRDEINEARLESYRKQLSEFGCQNIYINSAKRFIYDRVIKSNFSGASQVPEQKYVDQKLYDESGAAISSRVFARNFIKPNRRNPLSLKPISVIIGHGGIGKTTLCRSISRNFESISEAAGHLLLITKSDIVNSAHGLEVNSITDLYRACRSDGLGLSGSIGDQSFEIALSSGSLVVMVDGIDEIESALGGGFNMENFTNSIERLNGTLGSCKVFLTSRHLNSERFRNLGNANILELKGFSADDVEEYVQGFDSKNHREIRKLIPKIQTANGFVNPYLLSVAGRLCSDPNYVDTQIESASLDASKPFEFMLSKLLSREIEKQSLGVSVDSYYDLLEYVVVENDNSVSRDDFDSYVDTLLFQVGISPGVLSDKYLKCMLFGVAGRRISVDQEEYVALIRVKALYGVISATPSVNAGGVHKVMAVLGGDPSDPTGVRRDTMQLLIENRVAIDTINYNLEKCFSECAKLIDAKSLKAKNTIYSLYQLSCDLGRPKGPSETMRNLELFHPGEKIVGMHILGDFPALDFSGKTLEACEFIGYKKFLRCKFDSKTIFRRCRFVRSSGLYGDLTISPEMFDSDCNLDEEMRLAISGRVDKKEGREAAVRNDIKQILKFMRKAFGFQSRSLNKIKQGTTLISGKSYETILSSLCDAKILEFYSESGLYGVSEVNMRDAYDLCEENDARGAIKDLITRLAL